MQVRSIENIINNSQINSIFLFSQQKFIDSTYPVDLADFTVLFPSVCVGNVAQLSVDLLISSLQMKRVATIWHVRTHLFTSLSIFDSIQFIFQSAIIPILGPRAFQHITSDEEASNDLTTACELFVSESNKLACFQLRSPLVPDQMPSFFNELIEFLSQQKISNLLVLTSSYAHEQHNLDATKFMYAANEAFKTQFAIKLENRDWNEFNAANNVVHGGGFGLKLWRQANEKSIPTCLLFKYVAEGDNRSDAIRFVEELNELQSDVWFADGVRLTMPISWKALFGNEPTEQIY